jgi:hypothetical protein
MMTPTKRGYKRSYPTGTISRDVRGLHLITHRWPRGTRADRHAYLMIEQDRRNGRKS